MHAGDIYYNTILDTKGFQNGINDINSKVQSGGTKMKSIIGALGITKLISTGINMITNSLDTAISRIDTMNNFPKVMSNLGISATESEKSINRLEKGLQGLPTTLDAGALAVQRFTSKNGDVQKSTDIFLALNNAIIAGGASTQIQESALEQLSQAYSKGKMDMMEWRTLQTAMPAQLKQVADAMGLDVDALGEMMRQGDQTDEVMDQFINTIIDLNENGGKNIIAFKDQAKNATDGIRTNITNMKTAIARGTKNILESVNTMLKKVNINGIGDLVAKVGKKIESVLKSVAKLIEKLPLKGMINAMKALLPVITSVVAGFVAYNAVLKVMDIASKVASIAKLVTGFLGLTPAIVGATGAQMTLNTVMASNPIGLIITAVAGLTAGLFALNGVLGNNKDKLSENEKMLKEYKDAMDKADEARQKYLDTNMNELASTEDLKNELSNLVDENGKVKDGYEERAKFILGELNDALGTEYTMTGNIIDNYGELKGSIDQIIEAKRAKILLEAEEEKYNEAKGREKDLEAELYEATSATNQAEKERNDFLKQMSELYGIAEEDVGSYLITQANRLDLTKQERDELIGLYGEYNNYTNALKNAQTEEENTRNEYIQNQLEIENYKQAMQYLKDGNYEMIFQMYEDTTKYNKAMKDDSETNLNARKEALQKYLTDVENNQFTSDEKVKAAMKSAGEAKIAEIDRQLAQMKTTTETGLNDTTEKYDKAGQDQIKCLTKDKSKYNQASSDNMKEYGKGIEKSKDNVKKKSQDVAKNGVSGLNSEKGNANSAGYNFGIGFGDGEYGAQSYVASASRSLARTAKNNIKDELDIHSPSKEAKKLGIFFDQGLAEGIKDGSKDVYDEIEEFSDGILDKFENAVNMETGKMSFNGTAGSVSQILSANAQFEGTIPLRVDLDGEKIYDNQQKISARKSLQYGGAK